MRAYKCNGILWETDNIICGFDSQMPYLIQNNWDQNDYENLAVGPHYMTASSFGTISCSFDAGEVMRTQLQVDLWLVNCTQSFANLFAKSSSFANSFEMTYDASFKWGGVRDGVDSLHFSSYDNPDIPDICTNSFGIDPSFVRVRGKSGKCYHVLIAIFDYKPFSNHWNAIKKWSSSRVTCPSCGNKDPKKVVTIVIFIGFPASGTGVPSSLNDASKKSAESDDSKSVSCTHDGINCTCISARDKFKGKPKKCRRLFQKALAVASTKLKKNKACTFRVLGHGSPEGELLGNDFNMNMHDAAIDIKNLRIIDSKSKFSTTVCHGARLAKYVTEKTNAASIGPGGKNGYVSYKMVKKKGEKKASLEKTIVGPLTGDELNKDW